MASCRLKNFLICSIEPSKKTWFTVQKQNEHIVAHTHMTQSHVEFFKQVQFIPIIRIILHFSKNEYEMISLTFDLQPFKLQNILKVYLVVS